MASGGGDVDFDLTERQSFFRDRVREFIDANVRGRVADYHAEIASGATRWQPLGLIEELKPLAKAAGLWNLFMPPGGRSHVDDNFDFEAKPPIEYSLAPRNGRIGGRRGFNSRPPTPAILRCSTLRDAGAEYKGAAR